MIKSDFLVIGSGVAGLTYAIKVAAQNPDKTVGIITKGKIDECNTKYAQGGVAVVLDEHDSFKSHIDDTLLAGDHVNDPSVVKIVVEEAPERIHEIIEWGATFDKTDKGNYDLGKEGGHSANRILHYKDITGYEIERALIQKIAEAPNITVYENHFAIDLITDHHLGKTVNRFTDNTCYGAYVLDTKTRMIHRALAKITMLATGGVGQVYIHTTNPNVATGDGIAMAYRAKAKISEMEFVQFHPTALYEPDASPNFLISEAVRGFGAYIRNVKGERFVFNTDARGELASRDIVSQAIDKELKVSGERFVYLDCTHLDKVEFYKHFPNIYDKCKSLGIDASTDYIPVIPAAHYMCGGINTNKKGQTNITNLMAIGECARTGLHGANRLASNSLLEGLVFAHRSAIEATEAVKNVPIESTVPRWSAKGTLEPEELVLITHSRKELKIIMSDYMAIVRSNVRIQRALRRLEIHYRETEELYNSTVISPQLCELRNLITIAYLIVSQASNRKENKGAHFNVDFS